MACLGVMFLLKLGVKRLALHSFHYVWCVEIAPVGYRCAQVGYLKRCKQHFTLADCDTDNRQRIPRTVVCLVVILCVRYQSSFLSGEVDAKLVAESHAHHIVAPCVHCLLNILVFLAVAEHVVESPAEVAVARGAYGRYKIQRRCVAVAAYVKSAAIETVVAREHSARSNYTFVEESQSLSGLECRARRIHTHDRAVEKRFPWVAREHCVHFSALASGDGSRVIRRRRHHAQHLAS